MIILMAAMLLFSSPIAGVENELKISTLRNPEITALKLEIADTEASRRIGLMGRQKMTETEAMLFIFEKKARLNFWSLGCYLDLQVAFLGPENEIREWKFLKAYPDKLKGYEKVTDQEGYLKLISNPLLTNFFSMKGISPSFSTSTALEMAASYKPELKFLAGDVVYVDNGRKGWILPTLDLTQYTETLPQVLSSDLSCPRSITFKVLKKPLRLTLIGENDAILHTLELSASQKPFRLTLPYPIKSLHLADM